MTQTIQEHSQEPTLTPYVELFTLDCTQLGGAIHRFTPTVHPELKAIKFGGIEYFPFPVTSDGWETKGDGSQARPNLYVSNVVKEVAIEVAQLGDIVGAKLTRVRTFQKFLDGESDADSSQHYPAESYVVEQKLSQNSTSIVFQLASTIDRPIKTPRRQVTAHGDSRYCAFPGVANYRSR